MIGIIHLNCARIALERGIRSRLRNARLTLPRGLPVQLRQRVPCGSFCVIPLGTKQRCVIYMISCANTISIHGLTKKSYSPGQDWEREITHAVRECDVVIVCLSRGSVGKKGYVQKEIKCALDVADQQPDDTIFLIPLKLEACDAPERLCRWQWVNYFEERGYQRLMRALQERAQGLGIGVTMENQVS